jgi:hypothetical protein
MTRLRGTARLECPATATGRHRTMLRDAALQSGLRAAREIVEALP